MILPPSRRGDLKDHQWKRLQSRLPPQKPDIGRPYQAHRRVINGLLWILRTGAPWRDLPECYEPWQTVSRRFYRWQKKGIWQSIFQRLQQQAEDSGKINWDIHFVDGSVIRAHQHAAGARRGELDSNSELSAVEQVQQREALGWSKGGFSTKIHLRCDGNGLPITFLVSVGQRNEAVLFEPLMEQGSIKHSGPGRPRIRPRRVSGDKGFSSGKIRCYLRRRGIRHTIPRRVNEHRVGKFDKALYRQRNLVERCFNRLKQYRRVATRYEKRPKTT